LPVNNEDLTLNFTEKWYQERWCREHGGQVEVVLPDQTRRDCVTETHAIEFDFGLPDSCTSWRFSYARHLRVMTYLCYFKPLITQQMETSGSPVGWKLMRKIEFHPYLYRVQLLINFHARFREQLGRGDRPEFVLLDSNK
jgi:hypothetical protein